jgi:hypothetical protein
MKSHTYLQNIISILMIFVFLAGFTGCTTTRIISNSDLPTSGFYRYVVHTNATTYHLWNTSVFQGVLAGEIDKEHLSSGDKVHLYLFSDSALKIENNRSVRLQISNISKVEITEPDKVKTTVLIVIASIAAATALIALIASLSLTTFPLSI